MKRFRHDDLSHDCESAAVAALAQNHDEGIFCAHGTQQGQEPVTTEGDKMQVTLPVAASQSFG
jgi:hypothetical protein